MTPGRRPRAAASWVVLLRGINVGGRTSVPMARLRSAVEAAGLAPIRSYIQSGNLVLRSRLDREALEQAVEAVLTSRFRLEVPALARSHDEWGRLGDENPFPDIAERSPQRLMLALSKAPPAPGAVAALRARAGAGERVAATAGGVWIHYPAGAGTSRISPGLLDRAIGSPVTTRNWRTVVKLAEMLEEDAAG